MKYAEKKAAKRNTHCPFNHIDGNGVPTPRKATRLAGSPPEWVCEDCYIKITEIYGR